MVHILLLILKIIGIILGAVLAILLIALCLALFVPVRYRIEARRIEEDGAPPIEVKGSVTWLLHFVNVRFRYPADVYLRARLFLFTVFRLPPKQKSEENKNNKKSRKNRESGNTERNKRSEDQSNSERSKVTEASSDNERSKAVEESIDIEKDRIVEESPSQESSDEPKRSIMEKIRAVFGRIRRIFQNIWYTLTGICDKIRTIRENIEYYMGILQSDTFQKSFSLCKEELASIFSYIRPRKFQADLIIGMDDPAATGKILSYYGMLYPMIGGHVNIVPDFERKRVEGAVLIKGKIRLFTFIKAAVRIYFSKDIRKLLRLFKKEDV